MKNYILRLLLFIVVTGGCKDEEKLPLLSERFFQLDSGEHLFRIRIRKGAEWRVEGDTVWCKRERLGGEQGDSLLIRVGVNLVENSREVIWKVSSGNETEEIQIRQDGATEEYLYRLPTVFHILGSSVESLDEELEDRLLYLLEKANAFYRGENRRKIDVNLEFVPVTTTPDGKKLERPGISWEHYHGGEDGGNGYPEINPFDFMDNKNGDIERLWDPNKYINVYIFYYVFEVTASGYAALPYTPQNNALEGLLVDDRYYLMLPDDFVPSVTINRKNIYDTENTPIGRQDVGCAIFIHELGHYFGLRHVFAVNDTTLTDYCDDTPHYDRRVYTAWLTANRDAEWSEKIKRIAEDGTVFISTNIEDYTAGYVDEITPDQRKRIRHVLNYSPMVPGPKIPIKLNPQSKGYKSQLPLIE